MSSKSKVDLSDFGAIVRFVLAVDAGDTPDREDLRSVAAILRQTIRPKGTSGRKSTAHGTAREMFAGRLAPYLRMANDVLGKTQAGMTQAEAIRRVAERSHRSEDTVKRAWRNHRAIVTDMSEVDRLVGRLWPRSNEEIATRLDDGERMPDPTLPGLKNLVEAGKLLRDATPEQREALIAELTKRMEKRRGQQ